MKAAKNTVVSFHYTLTESGWTENGLVESRADDAPPLDSSRERGEPMLALLGHQQLVAGVERALEGREAGERFEIDVSPADAYGERRDGMIQRVPKKYFHNGDRLKPGMQTVLRTREGGQRLVTVHKVGMSAIDVDHNHPLAGKTLHFDIEVTAVRAATPEEISHGHAHPDGGHH
ncbi:MAG: peptidylprolyl isomerase [Proteobacteria bacterium]|nr:peptidylprolyl isomerase [Pseudomonadota bacterium]